jgi:hypothetical protein
MNTYLLELRMRRALGRFRPLDAPILVCEDLRVAYVPVPKAANSSIRIALLQAMGHKVDRTTRIHEVTRPMLVPASRFLARSRDDWFFFTTVRDPTSRAISAWKNKLAEPDEIFGPLRRMGVTSRLDFEQFLEVCAKWPAWALNDHFMPQNLLLSRPLQAPDLKVFHFESLSDDWHMIADALEVRGAAVRPVLGRANASRRDCSRDAPVSQAARRLLGRIYGDDYDTFGYDRP